MDNTIATARPDVVTVQTTARPTAPPPHVPFAEVLSGSAIALVQGAQAAVHALPGAPVLAAAVRGGGLGVTTRPVPRHFAGGTHHDLPWHCHGPPGRRRRQVRRLAGVGGVGGAGGGATAASRARSPSPSR